MGRRGEISYVLAIDGKPLREGLSVADRDLKKFEGSVSRAIKSLEGTEKKAAFDMGVLTKAVRDMGGVAQLSSPQVDRLTQQVERLARAGAKVPKEFREIEASLKRVQQAAAVQTAGKDALGAAASGMAGNLGVSGGVLAAAGPAGLATAAALGTAAAAATAVTTAMVHATQQAIAFEGAITSQAAATGISVEALQRYDYIAGRTDATLEGVTTSIGYMQRKLIESPEAFRAVGLEVEKLRSLAPDKQFEAVARAIASIEDPAARTAARVELLGRSSAGIAKFINEMDRWSESAAKMSLDPAAIEAVGELGDALDGAGKSWERLWITLGSEIAKSPAVVEAVNDVTAAIIALAEAAKEYGPEIRNGLEIAFGLMRGASPTLDAVATGVGNVAESKNQFGHMDPQWLQENASRARARDGLLAAEEKKARDKVIAEEAARQAAEDRKKADREAAIAAKELAAALKKADIAAMEVALRARQAQAALGTRVQGLEMPLYMERSLVNNHGLTASNIGSVGYDRGSPLSGTAPPGWFGEMFSLSRSLAPSQVYTGPIGGHTAGAVDEATRSVFDFSTLLQDATHIVEMFGIEMDSTLGRVTAGALAGAAAFGRITGVFKDPNNPAGPPRSWGQLSGTDKVGVGLAGVTSGVQAYQGGSALGGALGMAGTGAAIGSVIPGIGTAVGAVGGAVLGGILGLLGGGAQEKQRKEEEKSKATEKAASDLASLAQQIERLRMDKLQSGASGVARVFEHLSTAEGDVSDRLDRMGRIGFAVFSALRAEGLSTVEAMKQLAPALEAALAAADAQGTELGGSFGALAGFQALVAEHSAVVESAEAYAGIFDALRSTGNLDAETFGDLQGELLAAFAELEDAGFNTNQSLSLMAPSLFQAAQAAEQLGIPLDENTQKLVDQAEAAGLMDGMTDPMEEMVKLLEAVVLIQAEMVKLWGGAIPDAIQKTIDKIMAMPNPTLPGLPAGGGAGGGGTQELPYTGDPADDYRPDLPKAAVGGAFRSPRRGGLIEMHDIEIAVPVNTVPSGPGIDAFADQLARRLGGAVGSDQAGLHDLAAAIRDLASRPSQVLMPNGAVLAESVADEISGGSSAGGRYLENTIRGVRG